MVFAEGNISSALDEFPIDHKCNKFCKYYGLSGVFVTMHSSAGSSSQRVCNLPKLPLFAPDPNDSRLQTIMLERRMLVQNEEDRMGSSMDISQCDD